MSDPGTQPEVFCPQDRERRGAQTGGKDVCVKEVF